MTSPETSPSRTAREDEPLVAMRDIVKKYGDTVVLDGVDLEVHRGEVVVLIGPSGAGKSTLLRCINGLERIQSGTIRFAGEELSYQEKHLNQVRSRIGMVFQSFNLFPHLKVIDNLTMAQVDVLGRSKDEARERAERLLERVGLPDKAQAYPDKLSGGQQQRVAIARALAMDPEVMLFDEPTSALDPELVGEVLEVMRTPGRGRHDDGGGDPRDALRPPGRRPGRAHGRPRHRGAGHPGAGPGAPDERARPGVPRRAHRGLSHRHAGGHCRGRVARPRASTAIRARSSSVTTPTG